MAGKAAVYPIVLDHVRTLRHLDADHVSPRDLATHFGIPIFIGFATSLSGLRMADAGQVIAGAGILAAFAFGAAIFVFQLRLETGRDPRVEKGARLLDLLDELFTNVTYLIVLGLFLVTLTIAATGFSRVETDTSGAPTFPPGAEPLGPLWTCVIVSLGVHYIATLLMCVKRISRAYEQLTI